MRQLSRLFELADRLRHSSHRRFEEMGALAVTGQLDGPRMSELNDHIAGCGQCRRFLEAAAQITVRAMPLLAETRVPAADIVPPQGMQDRFLSRFVEEAVNHGIGRTSPLSRGASVFLPTVEDETLHRNRNADPHLTAASFHSMKWLAPFAAVCLVVAGAGFYLGKLTMRAPASMSLRSTPPSRVSNSVEGSDEIVQLLEQKTTLQHEVARMERKLSDADKEEKSLASELVAAKSRLTEYAARTQDILQRSSVESDQANRRLTVLQNQMNALTQQLAQATFQLAVQKKETGDATSKLEITETQLEKALDLNSAKGEFASVLGARNLHIVDVYDADASGKRQRPFGRVFYIEGKSLVFYAYDLGATGRFKSNVVFHVWGGKAGVKEVSHSLGILHRDDGGDSRWSMTFDDPKILAVINSVFVTVEAANRHSDEPHGKKILYAYFGSQANHP